MRIPILLLALAMPAAAAEIRFIATDLADLTPGADRWRYDYNLVGFSFLANQGFSIEFDPTFYLSLITPLPPVPPEWDVLAIQPDSGIPSNGIYDALALADNPPIGPLFSVEFIFAGPGSPGSQPYVLNQFDSAGQFLGAIGSGQTISDASVAPEPAPAALVAVWVCMAAAFRARRKTRR